MIIVIWWDLSTLRVSWAHIVVPHYACYFNGNLNALQLSWMPIKCKMYMDVPKCTSCHKAIMMMIRRACCIKIMHVYYVNPDLSIFCVYIYIYIYIYIYTKINKENNPRRTVTNSINCHTSEISGFVDHHLQPLVKQISSKIPIIL